MPMKSILATTAVVLGLGIGPALAVGPLPAEATGASFAALSGVPAEAMTGVDMAEVRGTSWPNSATTPNGSHAIPATANVGPIGIHVVGQACSNGGCRPN